SVPADASNPASVVVSVLNISAVLGSQAVLPCKSHRMVWTQDRLNDRQRVVHWDLLSSYYGDGRMERLCDMYSAGDQRVYSSYNRGRILMPENAFADGNFSLVIKGVAESDAGTYSCNLHHHYCHLYETVKIQLVVAKRGGSQVESVPGSTWLSLAVVPSVLEELPILPKSHPVTQGAALGRAGCPAGSHPSAQRCAEPHGDEQGTQPSPGSLLQPSPAGTCPAWEAEALPHSMQNCLEFFWETQHKLGGNKSEPRRFFFQAAATAPGLAPSSRAIPRQEASSYPNVVRGHNVINVIIPESRMHFFQQLGYVLATLLLFLVLLIVVALVTRRRRQRGYEYNVKKYGEKDVNLKEFTVDTTDLTPHKGEDIRLDYKNNILKEKAEQARSFPAKNIDLDKGNHDFLAP
ncbi:MXRA8 protein, partial [Pteruthius melanotis]|nr:MXRA8 protein [Pteruthius melanotis]